MNKLNISIGILTWKRLDVLRQSLESYKENGLLNLTNDITIFFQEIGEDEIKLANEYGIKYLGNKKNIGIKEAYKALVENAKNEFFLFLENDFYCIEQEEIVFKRLEAGIQILKQNRADVVRYRSTIFPGYPCRIVSKNRKRPHKTPKQDLAFLPSISKNPNKLFKEISEIKENGESYWIIRSQNTEWTNNPCLFKTEFIREIVNMKLKTRNAEETNNIYKVPNKLISFEIDMKNIWRESGYITVVSPGLFMHLDYVDKKIFMRNKFNYKLIKFISCFIVNSKKRRIFRAKYSKV